MSDKFTSGQTVQTGHEETHTYIKELTLTNWRQYEGTQTIELQPCDGCHINAIIAENGTGKTNLAKAVSACLNGTVPGEDNEGTGEPHVSSAVMSDLDPGETAEGKVTLRLTHQGTDYIITRTFSSTQRGDGCENQLSDELHVERHDPASGGWDTVENPHTMLARILPPEVQRYYFFDGERLDKLFEPGYEEKVETAVRELSHIEALERASEHLRKLRNGRRRKAKNTNGDVDEARATLNEKQAERRAIEHEKARTEYRLATKQASLADVEDRMGAASDPEVLDLINERGRLEARIETLLEREEELEAKLERTLLEAGTFNLARGALEDAAAQLERMGARGELPPDIRRSFLNERLDEGECICGCDLDTQPARREQVEELRDTTPDISDRTIEASYEFPSTIATADERYQSLRSIKADLRDTERERLGKEQDREELSEQLRQKDLPEGVDLEALDDQREQLRAEVRQLQTQQGRLEEQLESKEHEVEAAKERLERELAKDERNADLVAEVEFYKRARQEVESIKDDLLTQVRTDIETSLDTYYNELTWKNEAYDLALDDRFSINIEGPEGPREVDRLSAGETELLALSFIAALTEVSGFSAPVLIDTPVGRIDEEHRAAIADRLPEFLSEHQLTFLFTDSEYSDVVASGLEDHLAHKYQLNNDDRVTTVSNHERPNTDDHE
jgi:DNA sulfur modification protein DndD